MAVIICLLRGVNVGGHNQIKMEALRTLCESLDLRDACTYVQSGNVVFKTKERNLARLASRIEDEIERKVGFRPPVILRTAAELRDIIARNPFAARPGIEPGKLLVNFLAADPSTDSRDKMSKMKTDPEELHIVGRELFIYFPNGQGRTKLPMAAIEKALQTHGTGRNWNSVTKLLEIAERLEASS